MEERLAEIALHPALQVGGLVVQIEVRPLRLADVGAFGQVEADALVAHAAALLAQVLAFARDHRGEKIVEAAVAPVAPVELGAVADMQALSAQQRDLLIRGEQHMPGRGALGEREPPDPLADQRRLVRGAAEQAPAHRRRERRRGQQLRVIGKPVLLIGVGPGPVENILAPAIALAVQGHDTDALASFIQGQMPRQPAACGAGAAGAFQRPQKLVAHEGVAGSRLRVPGLGADFGDGIDKADGKLRRFRECAGGAPRHILAPFSKLPENPCSTSLLLLFPAARAATPMRRTPSIRRRSIPRGRGAQACGSCHHAHIAQKRNAKTVDSFLIVHTMTDMRTFKWSIEKERMLQELDSRNGINFADCVVAVDEGRILGILPHPRRKHQQLLVLDIENYAYVVPFVVEEDGSVFLKTVYPSRKLTRMYLAGEKL